uniref:DNA replication complex GINS protein PSF3 n=1 Tax=Laticauda laticaudata TaxID=8630 RepID=A0A8C5WQ52_LATLA
MGLLPPRFLAAASLCKSSRGRFKRGGMWEVRLPQMSRAWVTSIAFLDLQGYSEQHWECSVISSCVLPFFVFCPIMQGSKLEIPLWLAKGLYDKRRILSVELPKVYKESWRTVFNADASVVDLHKLGPYYYGFGSQLLNFDNPENIELAQSILQTFIGRFRHIMDSSQNTFNEDTSALVARLDELERALFQTGQKGLQDFQCWEMGQASQITISSLIQNYKKRKFTDVDS